MNVATRSVNSALWRTGGNLMGIAIIFIRSVILARLLPVEVFGIYAFATSIVWIASTVLSFGMGDAFIRIGDEANDEQDAADVFFSLVLLFSIFWVAIMIGGSNFLPVGPTRLALIVLTLTTFLTHIAQTPRLILIRRVQHRRLASVRFIDAVFNSTISVILASFGFELWALLSTNIVSLGINIFAFYFWRPLWKPRLSWSPKLVRYFLSFGSQNFLGTLLLRILDRLDDLWIGVFLSEIQLGFYSRAYRFATYPSYIISSPIDEVTKGTFANLKEQKTLLSKAFYRSTAFLVRFGFLLGGLLFLISPEFIIFVIGEKWLPMMITFRLMLIFALLNLLKFTISNLFTTVGNLSVLIKARSLQLIVLVFGLFSLGFLLGIEGVAIAVDIMAIVGIIYLFHEARNYVSISVKKLFLIPSVAIIFSIGFGLFPEIIGVSNSVLISAGIKSVVFSTIYILIIYIFESRQILELVTHYMPKRRKNKN